jgi:biofilm PGA synthesis N-glycosyltransferase PgaC
MVFFIVPVVLYIILIFFIPIIWLILGSNFNESDNKIKQLTLVIPFRNEEGNLYKLFESINGLKTGVELNYIFINDHSEDNGPAMVKEWINQQEGRAIYLDLPNDLIGKKSALNYGIDHVKTDWIWQLDADVSFKSNILDLFEYTVDSNTKLILAPVVLKGNIKAYKNQFQIFENTVLQFITSISAKLNSAFLANGANLFYSKKVFIAYKNDCIGDKFASGDDLFLLNFVKNKYGSNSVFYLNHPQSAVSTNVILDKLSFWNQKIRWASKMKNSYLKVPIIINLFFAVLFLISLLFFVFLFLIPLKIWLAFLLLKIIVEIFAFIIILNFFKVRANLILFPWFVFTYSFYMLKVFFFSKNNSFEWKIRIHNQ